MAPDLGLLLTGPVRGVPTAPPFLIAVAHDAGELAEYRGLRQQVFVGEQGIFSGHDLDAVDDDPRTVVLLARDPAGTLLGGVRLAPVGGGAGAHGARTGTARSRDAWPGDAWSGADIGWWAGSRLVVAPAARRAARAVGPALVRAACAHAEARGVLRFDALVQETARPMFARLGWVDLDGPDGAHGADGPDVPHARVPGHVGPATVPHVRMRWPVLRTQALAAATKSALGDLLAGLRGGTTGLGGVGWVGDDGAPVPGSDVVAACDAILPSMVERDPGWAGWCAVLVNAGDLSAMGAAPVGLLDAVGARDASFAARVLSGLREGSQAYGLPVLGGHTQLGVPASLSVTALGRTSRPVPSGGARPGQVVTLTADLGGGWRPGYGGRQWDSSTTRTAEELARMGSVVARTRPAAAKDVSMAGVVGTLGMLAESSGCGAELDVATVPRPAGATAGDWLTCFPGFGMLTVDEPGRRVADAGPATSATCGRTVAGDGVRLRWPDGRTTPGVDAVTGLGAA